MTRNNENIHHVHMTPFYGINQNASQEDVPDGFFVDGENLVCTEKPGKVISRPGYGHWMVDENGYGVVFSNPIAILPGGGSVDGVITPPSVVPITPNPSTTIPIDDSPAVVPEDGPTVPASTPEEPDDDEVVPTPEPPTGGAIILAAKPSSGITVTSSTGETVTFTVTENLPDGVTIATYAWDFVNSAASFTADETGAATSTTHMYTISDVGEFQAAVRGTGSDSIIYSDVVNMKVAGEDLDDGAISMTAPDVTVIPADTETTITIVNYTKATGSAYVASTTDYDTVITPENASHVILKDGDGGTLDFNAKLIEFTSTSTVSDTVQFSLEEGYGQGTISLLATQEKTGRQDYRTYTISRTKKMLVEIINAAGEDLTEMSWEEYNDTYIKWDFYARITAQNGGVTDISFFDDVSINIEIMDATGSYAHEWYNNEDLTLWISGFDSNSNYNQGTADDGSGYNTATVSSSYFAADDLGIATIKVTALRAKPDYSYDPTGDAECAVATIKVTAEVI